MPCQAPEQHAIGAEQQSHTCRPFRLEPISFLIQTRANLSAWGHDSSQFHHHIGASNETLAESTPVIFVLTSHATSLTVMLLLPLSSIARNNGQNYSSSQMGKAQNFSRISLMFLPLPALIHKAHPDQPCNLGAEVCSHQVPSLYLKHSFCFTIH